VNSIKFKFAAVAAAALLAAQAQAAIIISEVAPWSSGNSPVAADWFELTNTGSIAVNISGWKMDDNSNAFASSVPMSGITSIGPGESVIFVEGATINANFLSTWFPGGAPAGLQLGSYSGSGVGLGTGGDAVNIFDAAGTLVTRVDFGASTAVPTLRTFDNSAGLNNVTLTQLSSVGLNGAFSVAGSVGNTEIGSPGAVAAVPEASITTMLLAGLLTLGVLASRRKV
jgi:Lamin Tail Domain